MAALSRALLKTAWALLLVAPMVCASEEGSHEALLDLRYGSALYEYYQGDYFEALKQLHVAEAQGGIQGHGDNPQLTEAGISLVYGMERHATTAFQTLLADNRPLEVRNAAWFYLAKLQYSRQKWAAAEQSLAALEQPLGDDIATEVAALQINLAIRQDQLEQAEAGLAVLPEDSAWRAYLHFNLGAAYSRQENFEQAVSHYDRVSALPVPREGQLQGEHLALYDKALTAAGYSLMLQQEPVEAIKRFVEVRSGSPWSDRALLGYGWSALESKNYQLALQPWQALVKRPVEYTTTQEAMLALPYVYEQLDAKGEALAAWQAAEARFSEQMLRLNQNKSALADASLLGLFELDDSGNDSHWLAEAEPYVVPPALRTLEEVLSTNPVREKMQQLRDLNFLMQDLGRWQEKVSLYKGMVDERFARREASGEQLATLALAERKAQMRDRRDQLAENLATIKAEKDYLALAKGETRELNNIAQRLGGTIARLEAAGEDLSFEREAYERYQGILLFAASENYGDSLWAAEKNLRALDQALEQFDKQEQSLEGVVHNAPDILPWHGRLDAVNTRIDQRRGHLQSALRAVEDELRQELMMEIAFQQQTLRTYLAQSRLAIARLLDAVLREQQP